MLLTIQLLTPEILIQHSQVGPVGREGWGEGGGPLMPYYFSDNIERPMNTMFTVDLNL